MASSKCAIEGCKRVNDIFCDHCKDAVCTKHYIEHVRVANDELIYLSDEINLIVEKVEQSRQECNAFKELEEWCSEKHRHIDELYEEQKRQLKIKIDDNFKKQMEELQKLSKTLKETIDEGDASFKRIKDIKEQIENCCRKYSEPQSLVCSKFDATAIDNNNVLVQEPLFIGGTLLSIEHQLVLNDFYGNEEQKWILVYKATRDGFSSNDFHKYADNRGPTITVIQSVEGGYLFGGYTSVSWSLVENYIYDTNDPFLFTLTNPHGLAPAKCPVKYPNYSIYSGIAYGPTFGGGHDIYISSNANINKCSSSNFPHSYYNQTNQPDFTFTGSRNFEIRDTEVYCLAN